MNTISTVANPERAKRERERWDRRMGKGDYFQSMPPSRANIPDPYAAVYD
jgi:hypothetical protein